MVLFNLQSPTMKTNGINVEVNRALGKYMESSPGLRIGQY